MGPSKDGAHGKFIRPPKGPAGAGDLTEAVEIQVHTVVSFPPQKLGSADTLRLALQDGLRQGRCKGRLRRTDEGLVTRGLEHCVMAK